MLLNISVTLKRCAALELIHGKSLLVVIMHMLNTKSANCFASNHVTKLVFTYFKFYYVVLLL